MTTKGFVGEDLTPHAALFRIDQGLEEHLRCLKDLANV